MLSYCLLDLCFDCSLVISILYKLSIRSEHTRTCVGLDLLSSVPVHILDAFFEQFRKKHGRDLLEAMRKAYTVDEWCSTTVLGHFET
jgi:hypothetical protein